MKGKTEIHGYVLQAVYNARTERFEYQSLMHPMIAKPVLNESVVELFSIVRGVGKSKPTGRFEGMRRVHDEYAPVLAKRVGR